MTNAMKLLIRTFIIVMLMVLGAWLNAQLGQSVYAYGSFGFVSYVVMYIIYFLIGITMGTMVSPRFSKSRNKGVYFIPVIVFIVIGAQLFLYPFISIASLPWGIGSYILPFSYLSWTIVGVYVNQVFR